MLSNTIFKLVISLIFVCLATAQTKIVIGPVIGKVTNTTARILIEFDTPGLIMLNLTDRTGKQFSVEKNVTAGIPVPFVFTDLQTNTRYTVTLNDSSINMTQSYFTTLSGEPGKLNFAVVSCNDRTVQLSKEPEADLWADLLRRIQNDEIDYLLQIGDQVYMDDPFGKDTLDKPYYACMDIINQTSPDQWNAKKPEMLEIIRDEFRRTWSIPSIRDTLAKIPSLTIMDDHEIRDDWGYLPQDRDENSTDYFYGTLARQVYYEYERQLREDVNFSNIANITTDYYYEILNDIGFFFLDYRGVRTWNEAYSGMDHTQLGVNQTQLLQQVLEPNTGAFANLKNFFLVSPLTVVFLGEKLTQIGYYSSNDAQESWSYAYKDEQAELLAMIRNWKIAQFGRQATILDGDVHMGGFTNITYAGDFSFLQFTTSSIASSAPGEAVFLGFEAIKEAERMVAPWSYEHHDWTNEYNYGIILAGNEGDSATVAFYLVEASDDDEPEIYGQNGRRVRDEDWNDIIANS